MFIALLWLTFGVARCLGVPDHSSDAKQREATDEESGDRFSQFLLDLYNKRINESEWKEEEISGDIGEFDSEGLRIMT